ncbi:MAG: class II D-tagatose-bisphosphate aldolase, non-catalytic subunit [Acidobacteria bacterium]|nr:class II D-tagatose-bisphosphate aldolase, non-catalytic subunit [Acidobacteriota bacterium]
MSREITFTNIEKQDQNAHSLDPSARLQDVLRRNRESKKGGVYAVCSAHPQVIAAAIQQSIEDGTVLHVESTSSQVNQFGGYTGQTPEKFAQWIRGVAARAGLPSERVLLGGDHLGPFPWRNETANSAMEKACELVRQCVLSGYHKIHLDASMACADDGEAGLQEQVVAERAAILCEVAEKATRELPPGSPRVVYVIGTEVPAPGGELLEAHAPETTKVEDVHRTLEIFQRAFTERNLASAWERVVGLVVQPGVEFGSDVVFAYDRAKTRSLSAALSTHSGVVYEAHSTDYQSPTGLEQLVQDHFAILKVGPWLTFAYREAVLALTAIEHELLATRSSRRPSRVREALEKAMLRNPIHWRSYYRGSEEEISRQLIYSYSDRCRYYWNEPSVQEEIGRLMGNLAVQAIPPTLVSQFLPLEYEAIRSGQLQANPEMLIRNHVREVLRVYARACAG